MIITFAQDYMPLLPLGEGWDEGIFNSLTLTLSLRERESLLAYK